MLPQNPSRLHARTHALAVFSCMLCTSMAVGAVLPSCYRMMLGPPACVWHNGVPQNALDAMLPCLLAASSNVGPVTDQLNLTRNAIALWTQKEFDSTLGFPGEGPANQWRSAGQLVTGQNWRDGTSGPYSRGTSDTTYNLLDDVPASITVRNTFVEVAGASSSRLLRPTVSEPAAPISTSGNHVSDGNMSRAEPVDEMANMVQEISLHNTASSSSRPNNGRIYCPVPGCPESCSERVAGWSTHQAMRQHLNEHACGRCTGSIPSSYLSEHRLEQCQVCSKLLSIRFGGTCPRCWPQLNRSSKTGSRQEGRHYSGPSFGIFFLSGPPPRLLCRRPPSGFGHNA